ncbi:MAG: glycosyltransferase family 2 protein [Chromatiaceae bacterium]|nr:glycosyltransferase family 2 protein [Chromatiaceae bacterium]MBP8289394.1 glycosyltransferase family 2 protein [Chromatiaceae bacterium]
MTVTSPEATPRPVTVTPACRTYTIVIPIYNAFQDLIKCVDSVLRNTDSHHRILLFNDSSTDPRVDVAINAWATEHDSITTQTHRQQKGFVATVNESLRTTRDDVVVLNSDTIVGPNWLDRLDRCARSDENIGIVCPLSNNATILTIPVRSAENGLGDEEIRSVTELVSQASGRHYPRLPTAVAFCMLIRRVVIDALEGLDVLFSPGYGEECDYSMRAWNAGFEIACCDDAFVYHAGSASFGSDERVLAMRAENDLFLNHRWPAYGPAVDLFRRNNPLLQLQRTLLAKQESDTGKRQVLVILHQMAQASGTEQHAKDIAESLSDEHRCTILVPMPGFAGPGAGDIRVLKATPFGIILGLATETLPDDNLFLDMRSSLIDHALDTRFAKFLAGSEVDAVHFHPPTPVRIGTP